LQSLVGSLRENGHEGRHSSTKEGDMEIEEADFELG